ncbi:hypothetical protein [Nostoc sp. CHAB 5715]|nr:hypothetical protein [Nostoc sp. CHAB 5715]
MSLVISPLSFTNAQYFDFAQYKCPMPNAPCPMPHAQCPMPN